MIVTLTPNPSHDRTVTLTAPLERGAVQRAASVLSQAGGKGVNISRASVAAGIPSIAVLPAERNDPYVLELLGDGIDCRPVANVGSLRMNITISEPDGTTTKLNSPGPSVTQRVLADLGEALRHRADTADWIVLAGSLPPGAPVDVVRRPGDDAARGRSSGGRRRERRTAPGVDRAPARRRPPPDEAQRRGARLRHRGRPGGAGAGCLGDRRGRADPDRERRGDRARHLGGNGAVLVTADGAWHATPPPTDVVSTVGAGDSSLFGYLLGDLRHAEPTDRLALAVAYGSAAAGLPGTTIPHPAQVHPDLVRVTELTTTSGATP